MKKFILIIVLLVGTFDALCNEGTKTSYTAPQGCKVIVTNSQTTERIELQQGETITFEASNHYFVDVVNLQTSQVLMLEKQANKSTLNNLFF